MEDDNEDSFTSEEDFYAFLNVPRNATPEEISSAYRNLSRMYHPDKHMDENKSNAEFLFNRVKKAHEVLSDPTKRAIYDSLGVRGLETEGWEIVHRTRTPQEIREEYERLAREREERKLQQRTNPKGNITVNINATDIFASYEDDFDEGPPFPIIEVSGMSISQSIEAPITVSDTVTMSGSLSSQNGIGSGGFLISGRKLVNKGWFELDVGAGNGPVIGVKGSRNLTSKIFANGGLNMNFRRGAMIPGLVGTLAVQLDKHTVGYLTLNAGVQSSMSTVLEHNSEKQHCLLNLTIGIPHCYLSGSYTRKFAEQELKIRLAAKVGTFGYMAEYGVDKKVSKYSSAAATVSIGVPSGVTLKLRLTRSSQTFIFPIHLSEEIVPAAVFYATVTPLLVWFVVKKAIIEPMNNDEKRRKIDKTKELNKQRMAEKKLEAEASIDLMQATFQRIQIDEEKKKGLIILIAQYGQFVDASSGDGSQNTEDTVIDVTVPLQCLIKDSKLILYESVKSELPGFYDPCMGEDKELRIDYMFRETRHSISVKDSESLRIPELNQNQNHT